MGRTYFLKTERTFFRDATAQAMSHNVKPGKNLFTENMLIMQLRHAVTKLFSPHFFSLSLEDQAHKTAQGCINDVIKLRNQKSFL